MSVIEQTWDICKS